MKKCMGCMEEYDENLKICPHCNYEENTPSAEVYHMIPGSILAGRYIVGKALGYGGFGVTYIGYDAELERKVAIKEYLPGEFSTRVPGQTQVTIYDGERREQFVSGIEKFVDEAKRLAKFQNTEGVVHIYDSFMDNDTAYIVMEYIDGETLKQKIAREGKIPVEEALQIILPIASALKEIHATGIIHRDIAPDNIMIDKAGKVSLIDFGASRFATSTHSKSLSVLIKPGYAPVEQYQSRGQQGPWTDVYALAATLYTMVTGIVPLDSMERIGKDELKSPSKCGVGIGKIIDTAIMNAMNLNIEQRTPSMEVFAEELLSTKEVARLKVQKEKNDIGKWPVWMKVSVGTVASMVCLFLVLLMTGVVQFKEGTFSPVVVTAGKTVVPNIVNATVELAENYASDKKLEIQIIGKEYSDEIPEGVVLKQSTSAGTVVDEFEVLELTISAGKELVYVPSVTGFAQDAAIALLEENGLAYSIEEVESMTAIGSVVSQSIAAEEQVEKNTVVVLQVSKGSENISTAKEVTMPELKNMTYDAAQKALTKLGLYLSKEAEVYDASVKKGCIIYQSVPEGNTLYQGDSVTVTVSLGKEQARVPDVQYKSEAVARQALADLGLVAEVSYEHSATVKEGLVIVQGTAKDTLLDVGSTVKIVVSKGKEVTQENTNQGSNNQGNNNQSNNNQSSSNQSSSNQNSNQGSIVTPQQPVVEKKWSGWGESLPSGVSSDKYYIETKTQYSSRNKTTITSSDSTLANSGWTLENTETVYGEWGAWSNWSETVPSATDSNSIEISSPQKQYNYQYYTWENGEGNSIPAGWEQYDSTIVWGNTYDSTDGTETATRRIAGSYVVPEVKQWYYEYNHYSNGSYSSPASDAGYPQHFTGKLTTKLTPSGNSSHVGTGHPAKYTGYSCPSCGNSTWYWEYAHEDVISPAYTVYQIQDGTYYYFYHRLVPNGESGWGNMQTEMDTCKLIGTRDVYQYRTRSVSYNYTYSQWSKWSGYSDTPMTASPTTEVQTKTLYRYKEK